MGKHALLQRCNGSCVFVIEVPQIELVILFGVDRFYEHYSFIIKDASMAKELVRCKRIVFHRADIVGRAEDQFAAQVGHAESLAEMK